MTRELTTSFKTRTDGDLSPLIPKASEATARQRRSSAVK
jgi:hypothetical protein